MERLTAPERWLAADCSARNSAHPRVENTLHRGRGLTVGRASQRSSKCYPTNRAGLGIPSPDQSDVRVVRTCYQFRMTGTINQRAVATLAVHGHLTSAAAPSSVLVQDRTPHRSVKQNSTANRTQRPSSPPSLVRSHAYFIRRGRCS